MVTSHRVVSWVGILAGLAVVVGALASLLWARLVRLPAYVVDANYFATISERGHTEVIASDAWFVVIGLAAGLVLGGVAWSWFRNLGWPVALISTGAGLLAGLVCWGVGQLLGPGPFDVRLAQAQPGDSVVIAFALHAPAALAAWGLAAVTPSMLLAALGPEQPELRAHPDPRGRTTLAVAAPDDPRAQVGVE
nr:hypothetical protein [Propionibacterium sp.]